MNQTLFKSTQDSSKSQKSVKTLPDNFKSDLNYKIPSQDFRGPNQESLSKIYYQNILIYDLLLKHNFTTLMQVPRLKKLIVNASGKKFLNDKKSILYISASLELITGQKSQFTYARKSIANFKIRKNQLLGCKVVLQNNQMYQFLDKLSKIVFPRIRDYSNKIIVEKNSKNTKLSVHNLSFRNLMNFPELEHHYELVDNFKGMNCTFVLSNTKTNNPALLLSGFQIPVF